MIFTIVVFATVAHGADNVSIQTQAAKLEALYNGKLGFSAIDTDDNAVVSYHGNVRFPMCSTWKFMIVAAILQKSMTVPDLLDKTIYFNAKDMVGGYSPYTEKYISQGMTVRELCHAAILSDNTAPNLLVKVLGGIDKVNQFARSIGDDQFRLDRLEPQLNTAIPGDVKDTTTPIAMSESINALAFSHILNLAERETLIAWLKSNNTGINRIAAGVPKGWITGDKTGTCAYGTTNDIGIVWPPNQCAPIIISVYFTQPIKDARPKDKVIQEVTSMILEHFAQTDQCLAKSLKIYDQKNGRD